MCNSQSKEGGSERNKELYFWKTYSHTMLASLSFLQYTIQFMKKSFWSYRYKSHYYQARMAKVMIKVSKSKKTGKNRMISQVPNLFQYYQIWVFEEEKNFLKTLQ